MDRTEDQRVRTARDVLAGYREGAHTITTLAGALVGLLGAWDDALDHAKAAAVEAAWADGEQITPQQYESMRTIADVFRRVGRLEGLGDTKGLNDFTARLHEAARES